MYLNYKNQQIPINDGQSVLEALEQSGFSVPNSCRKGVCQSCLLQTDGVVPVFSQQGLRRLQVERGGFLACCCYPEQPLSITDAQATEQLTGVVVDKQVLVSGDQARADIVAIRLETDAKWRAGQYVDICYDEHTVRPYSIASRYDNAQLIELHIKRHAQGKVSRWLCDEVEVNHVLSFSLPKGDCCYTDNAPRSPLLMVATGTGLAPLYGILQEALFQQHSGRIDFYHAASDANGLYYKEKLAQLAGQYSNLHIHSVVKHDSGIEEKYLIGDVVDVVKQRHPEMQGYQVFLCGAPTMVNTLRRACFFQGAAMTHIHTDAFDTAPMS
ncbi:2Fe-2S iron-sulfur cluster-binding protein [Eionea flava]